jgi:parallel beta-helix repeat protein
MSRRIVAIWLSLVIVFSSIVILVDITPVVEASTTLYVGGGGPGNYSSIQAAIDAANNGDTVFVYSGTYWEYLLIGTTINLVGEDRNTTIIEGDTNHHSVTIIGDWVNITGFTVNKAGSSASQRGIYVLASNVTISNNYLLDNQEGIRLYESINVTLTDNEMENNGIYIGGDHIEYWNSHEIDTSNTVNGKPVYYLKNQIGGIVPPGGGQIILANCSGVKVENQTLPNGTMGITLGFSSHNEILNNNISYSFRGIYINNCTKNTLSNNSLYDNRYGIYCYLEQDNLFTGNNITHSEWGIYTHTSSRTNITFNKITHCSYGILLRYATETNILNNTIIHHYWRGIFSEYSPRTTFSGNNISSNGEYGIYIIYSNQHQITYNEMSFNGDEGLRISSSNQNNISYNNVSFNDQYGMHLWSSKNNVFGNHLLYNRFAISMIMTGQNYIKDNYIYGNEGGISFLESPDTVIENNEIINSRRAISLTRSRTANITGNKMKGCGIYIDGNSMEHWNTHTIDSSNTVNSKPVYYFKNQTSGTTPSDAGQVILGNSSNIIVENLDLTNCTIGINLGFSSNNTISGINASNNIYYYGIYIRYSNDNNIQESYISNNDMGIDIRYSHGNNIMDSTISSNRYGLYMRYSNRNNLTRNIFRQNKNSGLSISSSSNNSIYHNNFFNEPSQAYGGTEFNYWNLSYPFGGNYWSDFDNASEGAYDDYQGVVQNIPGSDGIIDMGAGMGGGINPYEISGAINTDYYPLSLPIGNYLYLYYGWNFISIPMVQLDTNLDAVLSSINGKYNAVQWYNSSDINDPWKHHHISKLSHLNDFENIDNTLGFWVHITDPAGVLFSYPGTQPTSDQTIVLHSGWNQVGYPSISYHNRTLGLNNLTFGTDVDCIQWYDAADKTWHFMGDNY